MSRRHLVDLVSSVDSWNPARGDPDESFRYIDLSAVDHDSKSIVGARDVSCADAPSRARQLVEEGDVLVSTVRPNLNGVAKVPRELAGATASTGFCVLRPQKHLLDSSYLFHWAKTPKFVGEMVRQATGASYPAVSDRIVRASSIPLPPLPEQRRIADILDQADAVRAHRRNTLAQLDILTQSVFKDLFGDPISNPKAWTRDALSRAALQINDCPHSTPSWTESGVVCLRTSNLGEGTWKWEDTRYVSESTYQERSSRGHIEAGDIILSREGTVGVAALVEPSMRFCMGQRQFRYDRGASS